MSDRPVVTRIAPSPTGSMHIGTARTALFNWLYAKHTGGQFLLRIEDTDRERSTAAAVQVIFDGLDWLGLKPDAEPVFQFSRADRHREVAEEMLASGGAYRCYMTPDELEIEREAARAEGRVIRSPWRDRTDGGNYDETRPFVVRLKSPLDGETVIDDQVKGQVTFQNRALDDLILLRSDGSPTYNLAVVVDDHDMGITHVIRGDDHLNNAARQTLIYQAMGWEVPVWAHLPLIHGPDGTKLSKRHGAQAVSEFDDMGYLPEAMRNYLAKLGWGHGDDEIISTQQAIEWFDLDGVGRSPSRFDMAKLVNLNAHYLRETPDDELLPMVLPRVEEKLGAKVDAIGLERITRGMNGVKQRSRTLIELADNLVFYARAGAPPIADDKARGVLTPEAKSLLGKLAAALEADAANWGEKQVEDAVRRFAESMGVKLGQVAQPLRVALSGSTVSPGIFEVVAILGPAETRTRLLAAAG